MPFRTFASLFTLPLSAFACSSTGDEQTTTGASRTNSFEATHIVSGQPNEVHSQHRADLRKAA